MHYCNTVLISFTVSRWQISGMLTCILILTFLVSHPFCDCREQACMFVFLCPLFYLEAECSRLCLWVTYMQSHCIAFCMLFISLFTVALYFWGSVLLLVVVFLHSIAFCSDKTLPFTAFIWNCFEHNFHLFAVQSCCVCIDKDVIWLWCEGELA